MHSYDSASHCSCSPVSFLKIYRSVQWSDPQCKQTTSTSAIKSKFLQCSNRLFNCKRGGYGVWCCLVEKDGQLRECFGGPFVCQLSGPVSSIPPPRLSKQWIRFARTRCIVLLDSIFSGVEAIISVLVDLWPGLVKGRKYGREILSAVVCLVLMVIGLPLLTQGGIYIFQLYNTYAASGISLLWLAMFESIAIGWVYGVDRFYDDIESMLGFRPHVYFKICYKYLIPGLTFGIFVFFCVNNKPLVVDDYVYPWWANGIGWSMSLVSMVCVPIGFTYHLATNNWQLKQGGSLEDLTDMEKKYANPEIMISTIDKHSALEAGTNFELSKMVSSEELPMKME